MSIVRLALLTPVLKGLRDGYNTEGLLPLPHLLSTRSL